MRDAVRIPVQCELSAPARRHRRFAQAPMRNAQLLKHFLAAKIAANRQRPVTLLYAYWEPIDVDDHPVFAVHRDEARRLAGELVDDEVRLLPIAYTRLWTAWEHTAAEHVAALRERYGITVGDLER